VSMVSGTPVKLNELYQPLCQPNRLATIAIK
jgi:hypothetical protein